MRYNNYGKEKIMHYGSVRTGFIIGLDKSQETVNHSYNFVKSYRTHSC